jgi:hypothetical protein
MKTLILPGGVARVAPPASALALLFEVPHV